MGTHEILTRGRIGLVAAFLMAMLSGEVAAAETAVRVILDTKFQGPAAPFLIGIDKGYYKTEGLAITIDGAAEMNEAITRVAAGDYDIGLADINLLIKYRDQNPHTPVKAVFMVYNKPTYAIVGRKSRGITKPKDLEGKKLGAPATDVSYSQWKIFAKANDIDTSKVTIENVGLPVREPLLQNGQVDAVTGNSYSIVPNLKFMGLQADDVVLLLMADYGVKLYGKAIIVNPKFAAEKAEAVRSFLQALTRGLKETARAPQIAVESVLRRNDALLKDVELERLRMVLHDNILTPEVKMFGYGGIDYARLDESIEQIAIAYEFKAKPKGVDIFDASFLPTSASRKTH